MAVNLYLIPRPDTSNGNTVGSFTIEAPPDGTVVFERQYGGTNAIESVIEILQSFRAEMNAMTGQPVAIKLVLTSIG